VSDFLVTLNPTQAPEGLLGLLRAPYGSASPKGEVRQRGWGSVATLREQAGKGKNSFEANGLLVAWVGDLIWDGGEKGLESWAAEFAKLAAPAGDLDSLRRLFEASFPFGKLNGASAVLLAGDSWVGVVTDPMAAVQVYLGHGPSGVAASLGTHPDLVAVAADPEDRIDPVSVAEFINDGTPCTPFTMHSNVKELGGGKAHLFWMSADKVERSIVPYWSAPEEEKGRAVEEFCKEFATAWTNAVEKRCVGKRVGVQLSGGMDSRLVLAAIPQSQKCVTMTLSEGMNRETRIAKRVAECYGREWTTLDRDPEYVARTAVDSIRFTGCEGEWHHAHAIGFAPEFARRGLEGVFTGLYMDNNFKGYYAKDLKRISRWGGVLPARFEKRPKDYVKRVNAFCRERVNPELLDGVITRREAFYQSHFARGRQSEWEWLDGYPVTQASDNTGWIVERRVAPIRLPVMDRNLVDLAFRIPATVKAGEFFVRAASLVFGPGNQIPNANDGVRPDSGHFSRLMQRSARKIEVNGRNALEKMGIRTAVPHSWHDYNSYWRESAVFPGLRKEFGANLARFEKQAIRGTAEEWLAGPDKNWRVNYRILQLAVWLGIVREYREKYAQQPFAQRQEVGYFAPVRL
jgi:hypothetical protein